MKKLLMMVICFAMLSMCADVKGGFFDWFRKNIEGISIQSSYRGEILTGFSESLKWDRKAKFTNNTGKILNDVKVIITVTDDRANSAKYERAISSWSTKATIEVSLSKNDLPGVIQSIKLKGLCLEGKIDESWFKLTE